MEAKITAKASTEEGIPGATRAWGRQERIPLRTFRGDTVLFVDVKLLASRIIREKRFCCFQPQRLLQIFTAILGSEYYFEKRKFLILFVFHTLSLIENYLKFLFLAMLD